MIRKLYSLFLPALMGGVMLMILTHPDISSKAVSDALDLCIGKVIPSLFPFMIISSVLISTRMLFKASKGISVFLSSILKVSPMAFQAFIIGCFCGFPVGASSLFELYKNGDIGKDETERLLPSCNMCSPAFVIFFSRKAFAGIPHGGSALYLIQLISSILFMIITSVKEKKHMNKKIPENTSALPFSQALIRAVKNAVRASCTVCGFVIMFYSLNELLAFVAGEREIFRLPMLLVSGILEVTCGLTKIPDSSMISFCSAAFFICFGGLSTVFQTFAIAPEGISQRRYIIGKAISGVSGAIIAVPAFLILGIF